MTKFKNINDMRDELCNALPYEYSARIIIENYENDSIKITKDGCMDAIYISADKEDETCIGCEYYPNGNLDDCPRQCFFSTKRAFYDAEEDFLDRMVDDIKEMFE